MRRVIPSLCLASCVLRIVFLSCCCCLAASQRALCGAWWCRGWILDTSSIVYMYLYMVSFLLPRARATVGCRLPLGWESCFFLSPFPSRTRRPEIWIRLGASSSSTLGGSPIDGWCMGS